MPHEEDDFNLFYPKPFLDKSDRRYGSPEDYIDHTLWRKYWGRPVGKDPGGLQ